MNDRMVSFYLDNPSGFAVEYGWGGRTIDVSVWQVERYESVESIWGASAIEGDVRTASHSLSVARSSVQDPINFQLACLRLGEEAALGG